MVISVAERVSIPYRMLALGSKARPWTLAKPTATPTAEPDPDPESWGFVGPLADPEIRMAPRANKPHVRPALSFVVGYLRHSASRGLECLVAGELGDEVAVCLVSTISDTTDFG